MSKQKQFFGEDWKNFDYESISKRKKLVVKRK